MQTRSQGGAGQAQDPAQAPLAPASVAQSGAVSMVADGDSQAPARGHSARRPRKGKRQAGMFSPYEWWISWRYLRAKKKENFASIISIISFLGIMLGVATLITVMAVMNGFRTDLMNRILGLNGHLAVQQTVGPLTGFDAITDRILAVPGVTRAAPVVEGGVMAAKDGAFDYALVRGMRREDLEAMTLVSDNIIAGSLRDFEGGNAIAIGSRASANFGIGIGDTLTLISPKGAATPFGTAPRQKAYRIAAIFHVGMSQYDSSFIFMPLKQAQLYFNTGEGVTKVDVMIDDPDAVKQFRIPVLDAAGDNTRVVDWQQVNSTFFGALQVERNMVFIIMALIVVVASLNIVSGLVMLVKDKSRDIAILRTMGATKGAILRVFLISGASIGVVGTLAGFGLGLLLCYNIEAIRQFLSFALRTELFPPDVYFLSKMVAEINNGEVITVLLFALTLSLIAPLYPAWRAAKLDPVEALRYE